MKLTRRMIFAFLMITLAALTCMAQTARKAARSPMPVAEQDAKTWKEFSSPEGRFAVVFPGTPNYSPQTVEGPGGVQFKLHIHNLRTAAEYSVMYADYPIPVGDPAVAKSVLDNGAKGAVASVNSELLELKEITLGGSPGRYLKERMPRGEIMKVRMYLVGQRMYQIGVTLPREEGTESDTMRLYDEAADKFLESFRTLWAEQEKAR